MQYSHIDVHQVAKLLVKKNNFLLIAHQNPDGDTIGACFALYFALKQINKKVRIECSDNFPSKYDILQKEYLYEPFNPEFILTLDLADTILLGKNHQFFKNKIDISIDHHVSNTFYAKHSLVNVNACCTCEIVYSLLKHLKIEINYKIATAIYMGAATDTGGFINNNTNAASHIIAAEMIGFGANFNLVNKTFFLQKSLARLNLESKIINNIELFFCKKCAVAKVPYEIFKETKTTIADTDGISNIAASIEGVVLGVTLFEIFQNQIKASLRSNNKINVCTICQAFGGGGHIHAAGCFFSNSLKAAQESLIKQITPLFEN